MNIETRKCSKCDGIGYIGAFSHISGGKCFACDGVGTFDVDVDALIAQVSDDSRTKAEWVLNATPESFARMDFHRISKIRDFCHGGWGLPDAFPSLLSHWFEVGEAKFQELQTVELAQFNN